MMGNSYFSSFFEFSRQITPSRILYLDNSPISIFNSRTSFPPDRILFGAHRQGELLMPTGTFLT